MSTSSRRVYGDSVPVVRSFYFNGPAGVNFCNPWQQQWGRDRSKTFRCRGIVKLSPAGRIRLSTVFYAERGGSALIGVGCYRHFELFCNGTLCCSTLDEGNFYDALAPENHPVLIPVHEGENNLEIIIEPGGKGADFCCSVLEKAALKLPVLPYAPVISHPGSGVLSILARTVGAVGAGIEYRKKNGENWILQWDERGGLIRRQSLHKFFLKDLEPGAEYEYRILMIDPRDPNVRRRSKVYKFTAAPPEKCGKFSFFFTADPQFEPARQRSLLRGVLQSCHAETCDFLVLGGDINSRYSNARTEKDLILTLQKYAGTDKALIMLHGNHELRGPEADGFIDHWSDKEGNTFYMFRFGDTAFLVLDAWENRPADHPRARYYSRHNLDEVLLAKENEFVQKCAASAAWNNARRRIILAHGASFSQYDSAATMHFRLQEMTDKFFAGKNPASKVHLWLAGHSHIYTRSIPGSHELTSFAMPPYPDKSGKEYIFPALTCCGPNRRGLPQLSAFRVDADDDGSLTVRSYLPDGECFEEIRINEDNSVEETLSLPHFTPEKRS